jgi:SAM-dependent methyltransferase
MLLSPSFGSPDCKDRIYQNVGNPALLRMLSSLPPGSALDCGCGAGDNAKRLSEVGWRVTGLTISPSEREIALQYCESVFLGDLNVGITTEIRGPFDLIIFSHVLEHLFHPEVALREARRLLSPEGMIAVALPNVLHWRQRVKFLSGKFQYDSGGIMDNTHVRFYTFESGMQMLRSNGFEILSARADGCFPLPFLRSRVPSIARAVDPLAARFLPGVFGVQVLYTARPAKL